MKKWIFVLVIALVFNYYWNTYAEEIQLCMNCTTEVTSAFCPDCGECNVIPMPPLNETEGYLALKINYLQNKVLAKYNVDIFIDDRYIATLKNSDHLNTVIIVEQGLHEVYVKAGNHSNHTMVKVGQSSQLSFAIKTHLFHISIQDVETTGIVSPNEQLNYEKAKFIASCHPIDYEDLSRYPERYSENPIHLKGKVISTAENFLGLMKIVIKDKHGKLWIVDYGRTFLTPRILVNDTIEVYGICKGITTYKSSVDVYPLLPTVALQHVEIY